ncbi:uncharacterized protein VICG_00405 [Vittaforma corneae ATCC 50505]|uniref:MRG domain-containing protein n=1 Tax=Vittaforma corneae (strain ATCC 50505) TaxID=993615 RepID=L2GP48_VITCO|nr:uncharacterized protein VICG_00405 [Vittaforma corneae ATCC 50505]ELA42653.1 hypothetical protein VICG_00405 [Vittaforma corneae ATCC 50505]
MENKKEKFSVNNYIVFKQGPDCYEGRIKNISVEGGIEVYQVFCFTTFTDFRVPATDVLSNVSQEVKRKMKTTAYLEIPGQIYIPPALKNILVVDKEWSIENKYDLPHKNSVSSILKQFKDFVMNSANICDLDEATEVQKGFAMCFNSFFKKFLMYSIEKDQISSLKGEPTEYCGPVHLLRLIYFIQKNVNTYIKDKEVEGIVLDYTIYLLDFMLIRYKDYF